jgi:hypothetical protein
MHFKPVLYVFIAAYFVMRLFCEKTSKSEKISHKTNSILHNLPDLSQKK